MQPNRSYAGLYGLSTVGGITKNGSNENADSLFYDTVLEPSFDGDDNISMYETYRDNPEVVVVADDENNPKTVEKDEGSQDEGSQDEPSPTAVSPTPVPPIAVSPSPESPTLGSPTIHVTHGSPTADAMAATETATRPTALRSAGANERVPSAKKSVTFNEEKNEVRLYSQAEGLHSPLSKPVKPLLKRKQTSQTSLQPMRHLQHQFVFAQAQVGANATAFGNRSKMPRPANKGDGNFNNIIYNNYGSFDDNGSYAPRCYRSRNLKREASVKVAKGSFKCLFARLEHAVHQLENAILMS